MAYPSGQSPAAVAETYAREWNAPGAPLDFSPDSLHFVEAMVMSLMNTAHLDASEDGADELVRASCYMGEVVRRTLGGEWAAAGGADMLRGVAGREGEAGVVIPLSDLMLVITSPAPSLTTWYAYIASGSRAEIG